MANLSLWQLTWAMLGLAHLSGCNSVLPSAHPPGCIQPADIPTLSGVVAIPDHPWAITKYETSFEEWDLCVASGGCNGYRPSDEGWGRGTLPVMNVSYDDVQQFITWKNQVTGLSWRLPSLAEWRLASLADSPDWPGPANFAASGCSGTTVPAPRSTCDHWAHTSPIGSFPSNRLGLHDMAGNVRELTSDCSTIKLCAIHLAPGGSWADDLEEIHYHLEHTASTNARSATTGFRLVLDLPREACTPATDTSPGEKP